MSRLIVLILLFVAALLETGGDALVRTALHASSTGSRIGSFVVGGLALFGYGYVVNRPPWDFGRLLGVYIVFFFVIAQLTSWLVFSQRPATPILVGGAFVVAGGVIMTMFSA